ncbi:hypothetical protein PUNSTDRAFT_128456 [Punctularia strigosozonata HHB-11173 SS5]|uniref:N-acetyltransferase domain-containing protein n=1 Tax=Punctularia strigosozonata (strain HHB-11173) TaxID=741275 RepID=R7S2W2_PUNST|nr:uncharacterized protein PUNSTDRAFT_128456 [Punctularia strigosozonata HHB-11173 SS5]EIN04132.1 hypothetical protein PUNSTDRAFT_128456 [Punctularia strigosozonata HHB-11173 SS5]
MSAIRVRHATKPTKAELDSAAAVLEQAFKDDAFVNACIGGDQTLNFDFQRATIAATAIGGQLWFASYGDVDIAGVAAWFPPGRALLDSEDQGEAGFNELLGKKFPPELSKWWTEYFLPKYEEQVEHALGEGKKVASWHLQMFGVLPELQNKGIGTALMQAIEPKAHAEGKAVVLETESERNQWKYESKSHEQYESAAGGFPITRAAAEVDRAATILAAAFSDDEFTKTCLGGDMSLNFAFQRATAAGAAINGELEREKLSEFQRDSRQIARCSTVAEPRCGKRGPGQGGVQRTAGEKFSPKLAKRWTEYFLPKYEEQVEGALGKGAKLASWHLQLIGVLPEKQNKGVGSALIKAVQAQAAGKAIVLEAETERNVAMYRKWGLESKSEERYESRFGGFTMWVMTEVPAA